MQVSSSFIVVVVVDDAGYASASMLLLLRIDHAQVRPNASLIVPLSFFFVQLIVPTVGIFILERVIRLQSGAILVEVQAEFEVRIIVKTEDRTRDPAPATRQQRKVRR
jgi:hypothetical protein